MVARIREMIPTVKSVYHPRSRKIPDFDQNYHFAIFQKTRFSRGFTVMVIGKMIMEPEIVLDTRGGLNGI